MDSNKSFKNESKCSPRRLNKMSNLRLRLSMNEQEASQPMNIQDNFSNEVDLQPEQVTVRDLKSTKIKSHRHNQHINQQPKFNKISLNFSPNKRNRRMRILRNNEQINLSYNYQDSSQDSESPKNKQSYQNFVENTSKEKAQIKRDLERKSKIVKMKISHIQTLDPEDHDNSAGFVQEHSRSSHTKKAKPLLYDTHDPSVRREYNFNIREQSQILPVSYNPIKQFSDQKIFEMSNLYTERQSVSSKAPQSVLPPLKLSSRNQKISTFKYLHESINNIKDSDVIKNRNRSINKVSDTVSMLKTAKVKFLRRSIHENESSTTSPDKNRSKERDQELQQKQQQPMQAEFNSRIQLFSEEQGIKAMAKTQSKQNRNQSTIHEHSNVLRNELQRLLRGRKAKASFQQNQQFLKVPEQQSLKVDSSQLTINTQSESFINLDVTEKPAEIKIQSLLSDLQDKLVTFTSKNQRGIVETLFKARYMESQKFPSIRKYHEEHSEL
ncbi:UNKNOWN [Stylonychia lemnae]|uniref:Uncharacterized protein n=1 Tax=Stylonychia lemnae TaxID=5949 RepID=A0A078B8S9_STYLE|nr:UNKNOWN [Stylonychia lemnae]|eukprot:CDW89702.1 UNKNOWN [Stylonychia lemnae]